MIRRLALALVPGVALALAWLQVEQPQQRLAAAALVGLAAASVVPASARARAVAALGALVAGMALVAGRSLAHPVSVGEELWRGLVAFYEFTLPFDSARDPETASLVLVTILALSLVTAQLAAAGWTLPAAVVSAAGIAWPATLLGGERALAFGALALGTVFWLLLVSRQQRGRGFLVAGTTAALVVAGATAAAGSSAGPSVAGLDWKRWDIFGDRTARVSVSYVWDANYEGIRFPSVATTVLRVRADRRPRYWRAATLDWYSGDRWLELLRPLGTARGRGRVSPDPLWPGAAGRSGQWLEQQVEIEGLRETRLVATGLLTAYDLRTRGTTLLGEDGALRVPTGLVDGDRYTAWSYVTDPVPRVLAAVPPRYPPETRRYLELFGDAMPPLGAPGRHARLETLLADERRSASRYRAVYARARQLAGEERSPYRIVLAIESWLRSRGGFRYDEQPARLRTARTRDIPPLVDFLTVTKAGYCQHYAGAMALMLRLLGIPSRVAVGFTSGLYRDDQWVVTDYDAHAWVEVWFPDHGWLSFDPTPGRGRLSGAYSFASESARAVDELGAGRLPGEDEVARLASAPPAAEDAGRGLGALLVPLLLALAAAAAAAIVCAKAVRSRARYVTREPRRRAAAAQAELVGFLRDQGLDVGRTSTLTDVNRAVASAYGVRLDAFAGAVGQACFGRVSTDADASRARSELRRSLRALRRRLGRRRRLRGALSTRSLRRS